VPAVMALHKQEIVGCSRPKMYTTAVLSMQVDTISSHVLSFRTMLGVQMFEYAGFLSFRYVRHLPKVSVGVSVI
jgi:hypothetical protein